MKNDLNFFIRFLMICSGMNQQVASLCKSQIHKFTAIGTAVLLTSIMAFISGSMFLANYFSSTWIIIGGGIAWGTIVWMLERLIITYTRFGVFNWGSIPRIGMAVILAFVVTIPLALATFEDAIQKKFNNDIKVQITAIDILYDSKFNEIDSSLQNDWNVLMDKKSQLSTLDNIHLNSVTANQKNMNRSERRSSAMAFRQYTLTRKNFESDIGKFQDIYDNLKQVKETEKEQLRVQKQSEIRLITNEQPKLLNRVVALFELAKTNYVVDWALWLFHILFFCFELLPITIKLAAPKNTAEIYDEVMSVFEQNDVTSSSPQVLFDFVYLECVNKINMIENIFVKDISLKEKSHSFKEMSTNALNKINNTTEIKIKLQYAFNLLKMLEKIEKQLVKMLSKNKLSLNTVSNT
jgi:hypothetical protein